ARRLSFRAPARSAASAGDALAPSAATPYRESSQGGRMAHPRKYQDSDPTLERLRRICLALPDAYEKEAWGECTFRVTGGSMFAMTDNHHHGSDRIAVWLKGTTTI